MNALTVPRTVAAYEYKALRLPSRLVEKQVIGRFLEEDSAVRLTVERALATLDTSVGSFLKDEELVRRGTAVTRKGEALELAASLEEKAAQRKAEATQTLEQEKKAAAEKREQASREASQRLAQASQQEAAAKREASEKAAAREQAATQAIEKAADARLQAEEKRLTEQQERIEDQKKARTAAPKAKLQGAVERSAEAAAERRDADRLGELAATERAARKSS